MGKWYSITYEFSCFNTYEWQYDANEDTEVVFTDSVANHILESIKSFEERDQLYNDQPEYPGIAHIIEITLLTTDGQKITGLKPESIVHLFKDYVAPTKESASDE